MNSLDAWFLRTPLRRLVLWLGIILPVMVTGFVLAVLAIGEWRGTRAITALVFGPLMIVVSIFQARRAYREWRHNGP